MSYVRIILTALSILCSLNFWAQKIVILKEVPITAERKADTVFGTWKFSVADYEFYNENMILLTYTRSLSSSKVMLVNEAQKILSSFDIPDVALKLYKDYMGFVNVLCKEKVFRVKISNNQIGLASLPVEEFNARIKPCIDTIEEKIYFSNYSKDYPEFTYYAFNTADSSVFPLKTITDEEQLKEYNMEYYFLKSKEKLYARKLAAEYKVDKHRIAAVMSGLTSSIFYTPLYAPLYIINDTIVVFDHYSNSILSYNKKHELIDSVFIDYHHPKSWREWKHEVILDKENNNVYALYQKNGYYFLKHIDLKTGKITGSFKLLNRYVEHIRVKGDYVYYVYRPFESLQEQFVYKELIRN
jgi:hypothetical protein